MGEAFGEAATKSRTTNEEPDHERRAGLQAYPSHEHDDEVDVRYRSDHLSGRRVAAEGPSVRRSCDIQRTLICPRAVNSSAAPLLRGGEFDEAMRYRHAHVRASDRTA